MAVVFFVLALKRLINKFDEIAINLYLKKQQKQG
jgi:hypothetical protein